MSEVEDFESEKRKERKANLYFFEAHVVAIAFWALVILLIIK